MNERQELVIGVVAAAEFLGVTPSYIGQLTKAGLLPIHENLHSRMLSGRLVYLRKDLERILQTRDPETGKFNHQGNSATPTVKFLQAQGMLDLPHDELRYLIDAHILKVAAYGVRKVDIYLETQSVLDLKAKRDETSDEDLLRKPLLDMGEACQVLCISLSALEKLIDEKRLQCLNIMPKAPYEVWRVITSSLKAYMSERQEFVVSLEKAAHLLGISRERVRQLIQKGKLEAKNIAFDKEVNVRWAVSRESIEMRLKEAR